MTMSGEQQEHTDRAAAAEVARNQRLLVAAIYNIVWYGVDEEDLRDVIDAAIIEAQVARKAADDRSAQLLQWQLAAAEADDYGQAA